METIGRIKYGFLKKLNCPKQQDIEQIKTYEKQFEQTAKQKSILEAYTKKINAPKKATDFNPNAKELKSLFLKSFKDMQGKRFIVNNESLLNIKSLVLYFAQDDRFFDCKNVVKTLKAKQCHPSFSKGLLIIGGYGNGKTSILDTFQNIFQNTSKSFAHYTANGVVDCYEEAKDPSDKTLFWKKMDAKKIYFDDVKTERIANNYGKANLFKDILEKRYIDKKTTYITCNYSDQKPNDLTAGIAEFGEKYGGRVYDRVFEMFNIIEFKGGSFRGSF